MKDSKRNVLAGNVCKEVRYQMSAQWPYNR